MNAIVGRCVRLCLQREREYGATEEWPEIELISVGLCVRGGCDSLFGCKIDEPVCLIFLVARLHSSVTKLIALATDIGVGLRIQQTRLALRLQVHCSRVEFLCVDWHGACGEMREI